MTRLLVVDDNAVNRELLRAQLEGEHEIVEADSGEQALDVAARSRPDLVLLDVVMPGMDGVETARCLKRAAGSEYLPVILVTALGDRESRKRGLAAGADELVVKPVDAAELKLRIANLLALRAERAALQRQHVEVERLAQFKNEMSALVLHDLKNPLNVISANVEVLIEEEMSQPAGGSAVGAWRLEALRDAQAAAHRIESLLATYLGVFRLETNRLDVRVESLDVGLALGELVDLRRTAAAMNRLDLELSVPGGLTVTADRGLFGRMVENVLDNAFRYAPAGGRVRVEAARGDRGGLVLRIGNSGPPIPPQDRARIFERFGQSQSPGRRTRANEGLGMYFCRLVADAHGGRIHVEETADLPTVFVIALP